MFNKTHLVLMSLAFGAAAAIHVFAGDVRPYRTAAAFAVIVALDASRQRRSPLEPYGGTTVQRAVTWTLGAVFLGMLAFALREIFIDAKGLVLLREAIRIVLAVAGLGFCHRIIRRMRFTQPV